MSIASDLIGALFPQAPLTIPFVGEICIRPYDSQIQISKEPKDFVFTNSTRKNFLKVNTIM